jgi:transcriptional regulator with XRE-family HTH domain
MRPKYANSPGEVIRAAREEKGMTQYALAKRAGFSPQALAAIEEGRRPTFDAIRKLCAALGIQVQDVADRLPPVQLQPPARPRRGRPKANE